MFNLLTDCKIIKAHVAAVAGTTELDSDIVDAAGFDSICWLVDLGTVTSGSVLTAQPQANSANSSSGMASAGTAATYTDSGGESSNTLLIADVQKTHLRFQRLKLTRTTQNAVLDTIIAVLYNSKNRPITPSATVIASANSVSAI